ncbi:protein SPA, chloroplastic isoform X1 [Elaeis guineensis]|uniref:protein SPA, chloroplastic isoform X1 n=1 Tax=Elaeis guineensis var. tenera TaxID=51953 RepID=UPI003C6D219C
MAMAPWVPSLRSSFLLSSPHPKLFHSFKPPITVKRQSVASYPRIKALELDQNTLVAISVGLVSVAVGIGIPVFYETQIDNAAKRDNTQPCFPCNGSGARSNNDNHILKAQLTDRYSGFTWKALKMSHLPEQCRFCTGTGSVTVVLGGGETEVSRCINCEGAGTLTCTTCQGTGIQPRYLDRREFKDDD